MLLSVEDELRSLKFAPELQFALFIDCIEKDFYLNV